MQTLTVNLGERSYPIHVGRGLLPRVGEFLAQVGLRGKVAVVTNPTVAQLYLDVVDEGLRRAGFEVTAVLIPDGEEHKNLKSLSTVYDALVRGRFERGSSVLALGGGVVGDLAGFAAASYLRGVPYVQVPTTLLAQVDSSVGGKTGINHEEGKNLIGAFYQPRLVVIDVDVLQTLPQRELISGLAEVVKYGIIADPALFERLEDGIDRLRALDRSLLAEVVAASCAIKARVVEKDEHEEDLRAVLNFGHTLGHALEAATGYRRFLHGEAVGIGMAQAAAISAKHGFCDAATRDRIRRLIARAGLPCDVPADIARHDLIRGMEVDKKSAGGRIRFVMCAGLGKTVFHRLLPEEVLAALEA
ncbi:MAG TPA: 3-dehydroquinate synthase [candidate division Zixibacteria bacterium]|nr:3-dehydroquinate synthase [candidate division Zixibacteria bacterium]